MPNNQSSDADLEADDRPFSLVPPSETPAEHAGKLIVSPKAARRIAKLNELDNLPNRALRVIVEPGGCHGYKYKLELDEKYFEDDVVFPQPPSRVVVDEVSLDLIKGSTVDFVEELIGSRFALVGNPNAESGCGCGTSFNLKGEGATSV